MWNSDGERISVVLVVVVVVIVVVVVVVIVAVVADFIVVTAIIFVVRLRLFRLIWVLSGWRVHFPIALIL